MNLLTTQTLQQPKDLNSMYLLASQWLKPNTRASSSTASTFATSVSTINHHRGNRSSNSNKNQRNSGKKKEEQGENQKDNISNDSKEHIECFYCGEHGHYANKCPKRNTKDGKREQRHVNVTWHASTFTSYYVYASGNSGEKFGPTEVLLDNQSDISVMKPSMLRDLQPAERSVIVNGAGGSQASPQQYFICSYK